MVLADRSTSGELPRGVPIVRVVRGERVESVHYVASCLADPVGSILQEYGSIEVPLWLRSVAKPFIAAAIVRKGVVDKFGLNSHEIAVIAGSHQGETFHVAAVRSILEKIGLNETYLQCGLELPEFEESLDGFGGRRAAALRVNHNCSGKHAGILALCRAMGVDVNSYCGADHPAMRYIVEFCARIFELDPAQLPLATDGCGIPVFACSLHRIATAFARLATPYQVADSEDAAALETVRSAMGAHPAYVRGTSSFDTELISATKGRVVGKIGAEGMHGDALSDSGLGLAVKVLDGNSRALPPVVLSIAREVCVLNGRAQSVLSSFLCPELRNSNGNVVGWIEVAR